MKKVLVITDQYLHTYSLRCNNYYRQGTVTIHDFILSLENKRKKARKKGLYFATLIWKGSWDLVH